MKTYLFALVMLVLISSCENENPQPVQEADPFIGTWQYTDSYSDVELTAAFTVGRSAGEYTFSNISVDYSEIPEGETLTYKIEVTDPFADGEGFGKIRLIGSNDTKWIFLILNYNKIVKKGGTIKYVMNVDDLEVQMINREPVVLEGQVFTRVD